MTKRYTDEQIVGFSRHATGRVRGAQGGGALVDLIRVPRFLGS